MKIVSSDGQWFVDVKGTKIPFNKVIEGAVNDKLPLPNFVASTKGNDEFTVMAFADEGLEGYFSVTIVKPEDASEDPAVVIYDIFDQDLADKFIAHLQSFHPAAKIHQIKNHGLCRSAIFKLIALMKPTPEEE